MRVLIVEDDSLIALCVEDALATLGFRDVRLARDLETARKALTEYTPGFAILDVNLGKETVFPFASELTTHGIPFLFSTGNHRNSFPVEWQAHLIVSKPMQVKSLEAALRAIGIAQPTDHSVDIDAVSVLV